MLRQILLILAFIFFGSNVNAVEYFTANVKGMPRVNAIIHKNDIIFQNLLNKRYVYTVPFDGKYAFENGINVEVRDGKIVSQLQLDYNFLFKHGLSESAFFNQASDECNKLKFFVAKNMLASDCGIEFSQYQMISVQPIFIRMIVVNKGRLFGNNACRKVQYNEDYLLDIEAKTYQAIIDEKRLSNRQANIDLTKDEKRTLSNAQDLTNALKPWEFGLNERDVILGSKKNPKNLMGNLVAFYVTYFNDIGCIPFDEIKVTSCNEYMKYKEALMDGYVSVSQKENEDKANRSFVQKDGVNILKYDLTVMQNDFNALSKCDFEEIKNLKR